MPISMSFCFQIKADDLLFIRLKGMNLTFDILKVVKFIVVINCCFDNYF
jgi:hypothetical protein